jgi:hypothetical protein
MKTPHLITTAHPSAFIVVLHELAEKNRCLRNKVEARSRIAFQSYPNMIIAL